jgi:hypothetical protein
MQCNHCIIEVDAMPVVKRFGAIDIRIYAGDHRPPHVHVVGTDLQVLVRIDTGAVIAGGARASEIAEAVGWIMAHRDAVMAEWTRLNERG